MFKLYEGDSLLVMPQLEADSVDSIVTDPPYGLSFMGKDWDHGVPGVAFWREALRVAKSGAFLLAFGGTRTFHRLMIAIEDAGWEVRDTIMWVYGSGFPKSLNVSKAIDKAAATEEAKEWEGWGTALKPAWEPIIVARKPLVGTLAENVMQFGTGGLNIDASRVGFEERFNPPTNKASTVALGSFEGLGGTGSHVVGRWPANLIHDGSEEVISLFPNVGSPTGKVQSQTRVRNKGVFLKKSLNPVTGIDNYGDSGSAARFFYCAKANKRDRNEGCEDFEPKPASNWPDGSTFQNLSPEKQEPKRNHHPTVKPTDLMRYLCRMVTRPGGVILDPFMGSGSTGKAAELEGFAFVGIDLNEEYVRIAKARIEHAAKERDNA